MRIVLVNWAPIREGAAKGGGVNGYTQALALELVGRGHEVVSLCGGTRYEAAGGGLGACRIERLADWCEVRAYEVVNSPVLAPSLDQFKEPMGEVGAPELEARVAELVGELRPDVVHLQSIEGFSAGCLRAVRGAAPGARVLFSLHNYHTICPQVYLMQGHRRPCRSFENGHACAGCVATVEPAKIKRRLAGLEPTPLPSPPTQVPAPAIPQGSWPPRFVPGRGPHPYYCEDVPGWRPLLNVIEPEPPSELPPNDYARRRAAMVAMLNSCDRVLAVSEFVRGKFVAMGLDAARVRTCHIGSRMVELGSRRAGRRAPLAGRLLHLAFMGYNNWYKGLPMLLDSLDLLTPEVLGRFHLNVYALEGQQMEPFFRALEPRLGGLTLRHGYRYEEIPSLLQEIDLGLVTSVWWDNAPQTVMEFFACGVPVLAAEVGGIPDFVREGESGLLFRGNDRWDLARRLAGVAREPACVERLRPARPKTMSRHAAELEDMYRLS